MPKFHPGQRVRVVAPQFHPELKGVCCTILYGPLEVCDPNTGHYRPNCYYDDLWEGSFGHESCYAPLEPERTPLEKLVKEVILK